MARALLFLTVILLSSSMIYSQKFLGEKMDIFQCISDVNALKTEIQSFLAKNVTVEALIEEISTIEPMVEAALSDCGITNVTLPSLLSGKSEQVPVSFDFLNCLSDLNTLVTLVTELSTDAASGNIVNIMQDLVSLRTDVVALLSDCAVNNSQTTKGRVLAERSVSGVLDCFSDINDRLVPDIQTFINVTKSGQIGDIIAILNVLLTDINATLADCQLGQIGIINSLAARLNSISPIDCLSDVSALVNLAETIVQNVENSQYEELINNLVQFVSSIQQTIQDCTGSNSTLTFVESAVLESANTIVCIGEVSDLAKELRSFITMRTPEQMTMVLRQVKTVMPACGIENSSLLDRIIRIDPIACFEDLENLLALANQTLADAESYDVVSVISDVESLVSVAETAVADCTGSNMTKTQAVTFDILQCINDVEDLVANVNVLLEAVKAGNFSEVLPLVETLIDEINPLLADCGVNSSVENFGRKFKIDFEQCIYDIESAVQVVTNISLDIQSQDFSQLIQDVEAAIPLFQQLAGDCLDVNLTSSIRGNCIDDVLNVANDVVDVVGKISNMTGSMEEIMQIIDQVTGIISEVENLENDCGFNLSLIKSNKNVVLLALSQPEENTCLGSVMNLGKALLDIVSGTDIMEKIEKIMQIKSLVQDVKNICLGQTEISKPESIVSYVAARGLRL